MNDKQCSNCKHWSRHVCTDSEGNAIKRTAKLAEPFWYYEQCKKNWGLPQNAYTSAVNCRFFEKQK